MKLSTRTRYGTRLMIELAKNYGKGPIDLAEIARKEEVSEKYLSQIIIPLRLNKLVSSVRGVRGGYELVRSPEQVNMLEIVEVLEGDLSMVKCRTGTDICGRSSICVTADLWSELSETVKSFFAGITLRDLLDRYEEKAQNLNYNI